MNAKCSQWLLLITLHLIGCAPSIPGVETTQTRITWQIPLVGAANVVERDFDLQGNAYLLDTYFDSTASKIVYRLVKVDTNGKKLWHTTGLVDIDLSTFWWESISEAKLLFDSVGNVYIVGIIAAHEDATSSFGHAVFSAKILGNGTISWQNKQVALPPEQVLDTSAAISSTGTLYVATLSSSRVNVLTYDGMGVVSEINTQARSPDSSYLCDFQLKIGANDNLYLFPRASQFIQLSSTGQLLQNVSYASSCMGDLILNPDDTVYLLSEKSVKKYQLNGTLVWQKSVPFQPVAECNATYEFRKAIRSSNATLHIMYDYSCSNSGPDSRRGYNIVQLNGLGEEIGRIVRDLPVITDDRNLAIFGIINRNGIEDADFQVDEQNNLFVWEQFATGRIVLFLGAYYVNDVINITSLTRKYDQSGTFVKEVRTPAYRRNTLDAWEETFVKNGPFFISNSGALSLFMQTIPAEIVDNVIPNYKYVLANHSNVF